MWKLFKNLHHLMKMNHTMRKINCVELIKISVLCAIIYVKTQLGKFELIVEQKNKSLNRK